MLLGPGEPIVEGWRHITVTDLIREFGLVTAGRRPRMLAIDGRSSSGKSTLAGRLAAMGAGRTSVVHTDDIAWHQARFDWCELLIDGILRPIRSGQPVEFRPPAWDRHGRVGAVSVPRDQDLVIVEGVGSSRSLLRPWFDAAIWVQVDLRDVDRRNAQRVAAGETTAAGVAGWMAEEFPFLERERPWTTATRIVCGSGVPGLASDSHIAVADYTPTRPDGTTGI